MRIDWHDADVAQTHDGHFRRAAADIDDHGRRRLGDRQSRADPRGHRLVHQIDLAGAGPFGAVDDGPPLDGRDAAGHGDDHARPNQPAAAVHLADEIAEHGLGDLEVADHAVLHRTDRRNGAGGLAEHLVGDDAHRLAVVENDIGALADGYHRGFIENDAFIADAHQRVAGTQVDPHIDAEPSQDCIEYHLRFPSNPFTVTVFPVAQRVRKTIPDTAPADRDLVN